MCTRQPANLPTEATAAAPVHAGCGGQHEAQPSLARPAHQLKSDWATAAPCMSSHGMKPRDSSADDMKTTLHGASRTSAQRTVGGDCKPASPSAALSWGVRGRVGGHS